MSNLFSSISRNEWVRVKRYGVKYICSKHKPRVRWTDNMMGNNHGESSLKLHGSSEV